MRPTPYAVVGVSQSFGITPDLVTGIATSTTAGMELVERLTDIPALNLAESACHGRLLSLLKTKSCTWRCNGMNFHGIHGHTNLWSLPQDEVYAALQTSPTGLSHTEARQRLARDGPNELPEPPSRPLVLRLVDQTHPLLWPCCCGWQAFWPSFPTRRLWAGLSGPSF